MITAKQTKLINALWSELEYSLEPLGWGNYGKQLLEQAIEEAKGYSLRNIPVKTEAKYFAVAWVHRYFAGTHQMPEVKDYLHVVKSCYIAAAIVLEFRETVAKWEERNAAALTEFDGLDYVEMNSRNAA